MESSVPSSAAAQTIQLCPAFHSNNSAQHTLSPKILVVVGGSSINIRRSKPKYLPDMQAYEKSDIHNLRTSVGR